MAFISSVVALIDPSDSEKVNIIVPDTNLPGNKSDIADFNAGFRGSYSYLQYSTSSNPGVKAILMFPSGQELPSSKYGADLAKGTGGLYRYVAAPRSDDSTGISQVALWRLDNGSGSRSHQDAINAGYDGISNDFNEGRGGDYLYVVWKNST